MLEELTSISSFGPAEHIGIILSAIANSPRTQADLEVLVRTKGSVEIPRVGSACKLLEVLGLCKTFSDGMFAATDDGIKLVATSDDVCRKLFVSLLQEGIIPASAILFDSNNSSYYIPSRSIRIRYAAIRNVLTTSGLLAVEGSVFILSSDLQNELQGIVRKWSTSGMTPEQLNAEIERNKLAGEKAETFVMEYERERLGSERAKSIERVSLVSVSAGFDIASFEDSQSLVHDRLIEVKAYGREGFFFSLGELNAARKYGTQYCLYIVELGKIANQGYEPQIIRDPANYFDACTDWRVVPDRLKITRVTALGE